MIKRFAVVIGFLLGVLIVIKWLFQQQGGTVYSQHSRNNLITLLLLAITWGTPLLLFNRFDKKNKE